MALTYVDANVLVYALHPFDHAKQEGARKLLMRLCSKQEAVTSALAVDELVWAIRREAGVAVALEVGRQAMVMPGLDFAPVRRRDMARALDLMADAKLDPRDAIHAGVAIESHCKRIASDDADFDRVPGIQRIAP